MASTLPVGPIHEALLRTNLHYFSANVLGVPYATIKHLLYPRPPYRAFLIAKRNGLPRLINEPRARLKELQVRALGFIGARCGDAKPCVHGFVSGRSILTNAKRHLLPRPYHLLNIDIEDFFPSISFYRVRGVFKKAPFGLSHQVATVLAHLCTYDNALPQGAPTSPLISNLVCRSLDRDLTALAKRHRATYTRYADDLTFSFSVRDATRLPSNICTFDSGSVTLGNELQDVIQAQHHFRINPTKTRLSTRLGRMEVTGIAINEFPNVRRNFIDRIRGALSAWEKYGYAKAQATWEDRVNAGRTKASEVRPWQRQTREGRTPQLRNVLWGKLLYVRMVRGKDDSIYTRLAERYNKLCALERASDPMFESSTLPVEQIVRNASDAEQAVFVYEWQGDFLPPGATATEMVGGQGSAFVYKSASQLVTCEHVLHWSGKLANGADATVDCASPQVFNVVMSVHNPTLGVTFPVRVAHRDANRDLALIEITGGAPMQRHFASIESTINRHETGLLLGFPNWSPGRPANQSSAVVASRYARTGLQRFEISVSIRQGNSGGPFVDSSFRVAGVAQQGATQQSGNDECLCVVELDKWLKLNP